MWKACGGLRAGETSRSVPRASPFVGGSEQANGVWDALREVPLGFRWGLTGLGTFGAMGVFCISMVSSWFRGGAGRSTGEDEEHHRHRHHHAAETGVPGGSAEVTTPSQTVLGLPWVQHQMKTVCFEPWKDNQPSQSQSLRQATPRAQLQEAASSRGLEQGGGRCVPSMASWCPLTSRSMR